LKWVRDILHEGEESMTTELQTAANARNATRSTGPKSAAGKARSAQNALRHGLGSALPVLPGERPEDWQAHEAGVLQSLAPVGALERELAGRVALCLWRLRRVARYETAVTVVGLEEIEDDASCGPLPADPYSDASRLKKALKEVEAKRETAQLWEGTLKLMQQFQGLADDAAVDGDDVYGLLQDLIEELPEGDAKGLDPEDRGLLAAVGIPKEEWDSAYSYEGWTVGLTRRAVAHVARSFRLDADRLLQKALQGRQEWWEEIQDEIRQLEREAKQLRRQMRTRDDRLRRRRMLPDDKALEKLTRYEAHLSRQMLQALHTLERLQAARAGEPVPPPAVLDVNLGVSASPPALPAAESLVGHDGEG
jgi:hypothetical protein